MINQEYLIKKTDQMIRKFLNSKKQKIIRFRLDKLLIKIKDLIDLVENSRLLKKLKEFKIINDIDDYDLLTKTIFKLNIKDPLYKKIIKYESKILSLNEVSKKIKLTYESVCKIEKWIYWKLWNNKKIIEVY